MPRHIRCEFLQKTLHNSERNRTLVETVLPGIAVRREAPKEFFGNVSARPRSLGEPFWRDRYRVCQGTIWQPCKKGEAMPFLYSTGNPAFPEIINVEKAVGRGCPNLADDVKWVQFLLKKIFAAPAWKEYLIQRPVTGN